MKLPALAIVALLAAAANPAIAGTVSIFDYNVVATNSYTTSSHVQGDVFVKNMSYTNSPVFDGNVSVAGTLTPNNNVYINGASGKTFTTKNTTSYNINNATKAVDSSLAISDLSNNLTYLSDTFAGNSTTAGATAALSSNVLNFVYSGSTIDQAVFTVTAATLNGVTDRIDFNLGNAATAIINVTGSQGITLNANVTFADSLATKIIWNFVDTSSLTLNRSLKGTVLGDSLSVYLNNANIDGGVYVKNFTQNGEVHAKLFEGSIPAQSAGSISVPAIPLPTAAAAASPLLALIALRRRSRR